MSYSKDVFKRLGGVLFTFYSAEELRKMSVIEVKKIEAFDKFNNPLKEGLYDPAMGLSPYDKFTRCVTCGEEEMMCPGHIGHIELIWPLYNINLINHLYKLLRVKCYFCHKVKLTSNKLKDLRVMFTLVRLGLLEDFSKYEE